MFIRSKKKGSRTYYWIVECERVKDKVIQKPIRYIGSAEKLLEQLEMLDKLLHKKKN
jgi:hypothetical protein